VPRRHLINYLAGNDAQKNLDGNYLTLNRLCVRSRASFGASVITVVHPGDLLMQTPTQVTNEYISLINHPSFLRSVLKIDAATCVASGLLMSLGSSVVAELTQIPSGLLMSAGLSLFPIAGFIIFVAVRTPLWFAGVWLIIAGNIGWVLGSLWPLTGGAMKVSAFGFAFVLMQAAAVVVLASLEFLGQR
jgi:hypothetical protein